MALTNAQRQKQYRERMRSQNPEKFEKIKKKNAERNKKRKKIEECSKEVVELKRKQWRASQNRHRSKGQDYVPNHENDITDCEGNDARIDSKISVERKKLKRRWALQKKSYEDRVKNMATEIQSLKKKCKRYMQKNKKLIAVIDELKSKASESQGVIQNKEMILAESCVQDENEMTPLSKSNNFIEKNLPNIGEIEKEKVKRQLLTHNVLVNAIQDTYTETKKNEERNILKRILEKDIITKYKKKSEITHSVLGLKGRIRQRKMLARKNNIIINEITKFYNRDDVTRASAGKKEVKIKGKIEKQKRYLLDTIKELYKKYRAEGGRAKRSSFQKYKPFYVVEPKLSDRETCGCQKHENFFMKIKKLRSLGMIETTSVKEILSQVVCDLNSQECAYGDCSICINKCITFSDDTYDMNKIVTWNEFAIQTHEYTNKKDGKTMTTKKMVKKEVQGKLETLTELFNKEIKMMRKHEFNIKHQYQQYLLCINNLKPSEVAIHVDFSENYVCKLATEVQSMHFGASKSQVTIHTGVLYMKDKDRQSFASISPSNEHGPEAIWAHLKPILMYVKEKFPIVKAVHFFSDGPTTQYKQKKNFYLFTEYTKDMGFPHSTWNFSESSHGKGAADGVGGGLKRRLDDFVKYGTDIPDAYTAYTLLKNSDTSVMTFYIQEADIAEYSVDEDLTPVPQTMNLHQITNTDTTNVLRFRCLSCFCGDSQRGYCECLNVKNHQVTKPEKTDKNNKTKTKNNNLKRRNDEDEERKQKGKKKAKVPILSEIQSTTDEDEQYSVHDSSEDIICEDLLSDTDEGLININSNEYEIVPENSEKIFACSSINTSKGGLLNIDANENEIVAENSGKIYACSLINTSKAGLLNINENENKNVPENPGKIYACSLINTSKSEMEENMEENIEEEKPYDVDDAVIVRYYLSNKWKYYLGFVEKIDIAETGTLYTVRFLKTIKKPTLKFIKVKKVDRDVVPEISIVKKVELAFNSKEYIMKDDDGANYIYF